MLAREEVPLRHELGLDRLMWATDFPHPEGSWPNTREQPVHTLCGIPEHEIEALLGLHAARFHGIDPAPIAEKIGPEKAWFRE